MCVCNFLHPGWAGNFQSARLRVRKRLKKKRKGRRKHARVNILRVNTAAARNLILFRWCPPFRGLSLSPVLLSEKWNSADRRRRSDLELYRVSLGFSYTGGMLPGKIPRGSSLEPRIAIDCDRYARAISRRILNT